MRIKYLDQINNFWALTEEINDLSPIDISVYFALLKYNNSLNWINPFYCDWSIITQYSRVSKNSYYSSLQKLQNYKLITYEKGIRNVLKAKISILILKNRKGTIKEQHEEQKVEQNEEQKGNLYRILDLKTIRLIELNTKVFNENIFLWFEKYNKSLKAEKRNTDSLVGGEKNQKFEIVYPYTSEKFMSRWNTLMENPKWKKKKPTAVQMSLMQLSEFNEEFSIILIETAIAGDYQGLVFADTKEKFNKFKNNNNGTSNNSADTPSDATKKFNNVNERFYAERDARINNNSSS